MGSVIVVHRLGCSIVSGIFLDQELNLGLLHWQVNSLPLSHKGSPEAQALYVSMQKELSERQSDR